MSCRAAFRRFLGALLARPLAVLAQPALFHEHGHGLSFSPDGKTLFAPSHQGLALYHDGRWEEAPGPARGYSGFYRERARPLLVGLYLTTDEGRTWRHAAARGLRGESNGPR